MERLLEIIGNKKLAESFAKNDIKTFQQIALKLYSKARLNQDKKEHLLSECLNYSRNETTNIDEAMRVYKDRHCQEFALKKRVEIQCTAEYIEEKDVLKRYDMKISAYERAYESCMES